MPDSAQDQLKRAAVALQTLRQRYEALESRQREPIAIVGASCRLPGGANDLDSYWRLIAGGVDAIGPNPPGRWEGEAHLGGFLDRPVDEFDAAFFGIAPREADQMDPQQRLALELVWEALENAGCAPDRLSNTRTGVFLGLMSNDYGRMVHREGSGVDIYSGTGNDASFLAGRVSYVLGLQGPSMVVSTSCSSSLLAAHLAVQSLRRGECRVALAGGVNLMLAPDLFVLLSKMKALSADGRCHSFDADATGFGRGEGGGMVVLKRLSDAVADRDHIIAVIRGSATNHDGHSNGLTAPNGAAQEAVLRAALADAGLEAGAVGYLEAHGTGTPLGDPIELQAAAAVLAEGRSLRVGSVKANIGHLEAAAGVASLLKAALVVNRGAFPPQANFHAPNPRIPWDRFVLPGALEAWTETRRIAGVSSFGMSGTNAHLVIESYEAEQRAPSERRPVLVLSAATEMALAAQEERFSAYLKDTRENLEDVAYTAAAGRAALPVRVAKSSTQVWRGRFAEPPKVAFLFSGQGAQYASMGRELLATERVFREEIERLSAAIEGEWGGGELERLLRDGTDQELKDTRRTQAVIYALQCGLTRLWASWGVLPDVVLGHSVGEYAAAAAAGVFTPVEGMRLIARRGALMAALPAGGAMAAILCGEDRARGWLDDGVVIAAENAPESVTVSGAAAAVDRAIARAAAAGVVAQKLQVSHAFHSALMDPMLGEWERFAATYRGRPRNAVWLSTLTGERVDEVSGDYWRRQVRERVRYRAAVEKAIAEGCTAFVEIGPGGALAGLGKRCEGAPRAEWFVSLTRGREAREQLEESAARLWVKGATVDWESFYRGRNVRRVPLPTYPFERRRHWFRASETAYRLEWIDAPLPVPRIEEVLREGAAKIDVEGVAAINRKLDRLCLDYAREAMSRADLRVAPRHQRLANLLREWLKDDPGPSGFSPETLIAEHPQFAGYVRMLARCGPKLADVMAGEDPLPLLFPGGSFTEAQEIYEGNEYAALMNRAVAEAVVGFSPQRVLEVGAGTGGTTSAVLPALGAGVSYTFTDLSTIFLTRARQKFASHPNVEYRLLDLERDSEAQGFVAASYDVIVAANCLHATADVRAVLRRLRGLLKPGGRIVILEVTQAQRMIDLTFGLTEGWWRFEDLELRPSHALMPAGTWATALRDAGFETAETFPRGENPAQSVIVGSNAVRGTVLRLDTGASTVERLCERIQEAVRHAPSQLTVAWPEAPPEISGALRGFLRCVAVEAPRVNCRWIEYSDAAALDRELASPSVEQEVRLGASRQVSRLVPYALDAPAFAPRSDRTYLITGGLGTLGLSLAQWLSERGAGEMVLVTRRADAAPPSIPRTRVERADVADTDAMRGVLVRCGRLAGVFHAAGESSVVALDELTPDEIARMFRGKAHGARVLDELTAGMPLDCFVMFSSAAAVWGSARLAHYAAANGYLDGLVESRVRRGLPALSIQLGRLSERGMVPETEYRHFDRMGLLPMPLDAAWETMARLIGGGAPSSVVARVDWDRFLPVHQAQGARRTFFEAIPVKATPQPTAAKAARLAGTVADKVAALVGQVLGYAPGETVVRDRGLFELGLDSLTAVELRDRLATEFERPLPATLLFECPTVDALIEFLAPSATAVKVERTHEKEAAIAIVGAGCRLPGSIDSPEAFWEALLAGRDLVGRIPADRWDVDGLYDPAPATPGRMYTREGGFLDRVDLFDAAHFGISAREAARMDPQQRLLLEVAWEALEHAGIPPRELRGSPTGVFTGITTCDYAALLHEAGALGDGGLFGISGTALNAAPGRISYALGLNGPSVAIDTACSSSLVAVHQACAALSAGECDVALAGGVNVILRPDVHVLASQARMLARDGRCKTFDSAADGFGRAEGCVLLVLKRLPDALAAGDRVMAVIAGSAVNHGGASGGFSVPNPKAQTAVIGKALRAAGVDPAEVAFVETHGTGTSLGDPIEVRALAEALQARAPERREISLGAVKSNLGHAESAAGAVSLLKAALAVSHGVVPPNLHCHAPNPAVEWDELPFRLPARVSQWPEGYTRRVAGVSSFGMSGTNAHVVVTAGREGGRAPLARTPFNRQRHWVDAPKREVAVEHIYRPVWPPVELPATAACDGWLRLGPEWSTLPDGRWPGAIVTLRGMSDSDPSGSAEETMRRLLAVARWMDRAGASFPVWFESAGPNPVASGFVRTLAIENAHRTIGFCEHDNPAILENVLGQAAYRDVRVRAGRVYSMRLADEPLLYREFKPPPDRTYLITGGLGDIGAMCARILIDRGARHVVLTGKRPLDDERRARLAALAPAVYIQSDVASAEETAALFVQLRAEFPQVAGVIHSAMLLSDRPASLLSDDDARAVLAPKIAGTWNLHRETLADPPDLFVMLSSVSGVLGNAGQCAYAAGNAFQDAFAHQRRAAGLPAVAIDLGPVEDTAAIRRVASRRFAPSVRALSALQTVRGIEAILAADGAQYVLCALERSATRQAATTLAGADPLDYPRLLREIAAAVLDQPPESLEPDRPLQEYGLDSLLSLELRNRLAAGSEVELPASLLFDYPTLDALARYLSERFTPVADDDAEALLDQLASKVLKAEGLG